MQLRTLSVIALSNRDFPSFAAKMEEAARWIAIAAGRKSDLAVLPEFLNVYCGDGPDNPNAMRLEDAALDDWETATAPLREAAVKHRIAVTIPVLIRENGKLRNVSFLIAKEGKVLGSYAKIFPTLGELEAGVVPGALEQAPIVWEGIRVGGAICFDTNFPAVFEAQTAAGAQLFLCPSLWPGGDWLNYYAARYSVPMALSYPAWSRIIDLNGRELTAGGYRSETLRFGFGLPVYTATLNFDRMRVFADLSQKTLIALESKYGGKIATTHDQNNSIYTLESVSPDLTMDEVAGEFGLIHHRDYLAQSERAVRSR